MAFQEKIDQLVTKLTELTDSAKVSWEETADEDTFLTSVGKFVVTLAKELRDDYGDSHDAFRVKILDAAGKTIEEAYKSGGGEDWQRLRLLHDLARRNALHVEEALSDLLSSLEHI